MSVRLPHGDDAGCLAARRMGDQNHASSEQAQGEKPFLSIIETVIREGDARPGKHLPGVFKSQPMLGEVAPVFRLALLIDHFAL